MSESPKKQDAIEGPPYVRLDDDGASGEIRRLEFHSRPLHRVLSEVPEDERPGKARDALEIGAEVLARQSHRGDLDQVANAIEQLGAQGQRIIDNMMTAGERVVDDTSNKLTEQLAAEGGPLAGLLDLLDPTADGNVIEGFRDLASSTISKASKQAVADMAESRNEELEAFRKQIESFTNSAGILAKVAAAEEARLEEAKRGTAKGRVHELDVESLLGDLVAVTGDGLDDVSNVFGLDGTRQGDKIIRPRGGVPIVTEEKCTKPVTEAKARVLLADAMRNRGAAFGMLIVDDESKVPGNQPYHLIDDDMVVVAADPVGLRLVYCLIRSRAIEAAQTVRAVDDHAAVESLEAIRGHVDDIARALDRFKLIRTEHTKATKAIAQATGYVDDLGALITKDVTEITLLIKEGVGDDHPEEAA